MDQYFPAGQVTARPERYAEIGRPISPTEAMEAAQLARRAGLHRLDERWRRPGRAALAG